MPIASANPIIDVKKLSALKNVEDKKIISDVNRRRDSAPKIRIAIEADFMAGNECDKAVQATTHDVFDKGDDVMWRTSSPLGRLQGTYSLL